MIYVSFALAAIFLSCKKGDEATPSANVTKTINVPNGPVTRADLYPENGFISGTISGKLSDGTPFQKTFMHQLDVEIPTCRINTDGRYVIRISKADKTGRVGTEDKQTDMTFIMKLSNDDIYSMENFNTSIYVDSSATLIRKFEVEQTGSTSTVMTMTNVSFNPASGTFSADYVMNISGNYTSSKKNATITGQIQTNLTTVSYRTSN